MVLPKHQESEAVKEENNITQRIQVVNFVLFLWKDWLEEKFIIKKKKAHCRRPLKAVMLSWCVSSKTAWQTVKYIEKRQLSSYLGARESK